jgi:hypothetical protein
MVRKHRWRHELELSEFTRSLSHAGPPAAITPILLALWHDARGDWQRAHAIVQSDGSPAATRVHAYLHRKEGDLSNAEHWYRRAGDAMPTGTLDEEGRNLAALYLAQSATVMSPTFGER